MRRRILKLMIRLVIELILFTGVAGLFCWVTLGPIGGAQLDEYFRSQYINSEAVYMTFVFCAILLIGLVILAVSSFRTAKTLIAIRDAWRDVDKTRSKGRETIRFSSLNEIDKHFANNPVSTEGYDGNITLKELCVRFRNYAAGKLGLYYSIEDIRRFVAGFGVSKLLILQGISGTGKTSLAYAMGQFLQNDSVVVPVQPMWKERSDLVGYFNEFTKHFNETVLLRKMYEACYRKDIYVTILDEVNISRIEYYFAEFLSLLALPDENRRLLDVVSDVWPNDPKLLRDGRIRLPENMWFIGTANNDDSTFAISDKVYDRAMVMSLDKKCEPFEAEAAEPILMTCKHFNSLISDAKSRASLSKSLENKIIQLDKYMISTFTLSFGNRIMRQIREYVPILIACGGTEAEAVDDILVRKVFRKLETLNPSFVHNNLDDLKDHIVSSFGYSTLPQCMEYLQSLEHMM